MPTPVLVVNGYNTSGKFLWGRTEVASVDWTRCPASSLAIHADLDTVVLQQAREFQAGELTTLVRVEDGRCAVAVDGFLHGVQTEVDGQGIGQTDATTAAGGSPSLSRRTNRRSLVASGYR